MNHQFWQEAAVQCQCWAWVKSSQQNVERVWNSVITVGCDTNRWLWWSDGERNYPVMGSKCWLRANFTPQLVLFDSSKGEKQNCSLLYDCCIRLNWTWTWTHTMNWTRIVLRIQTNLISVTILKISLVILLTMFSSMICDTPPTPHSPALVLSHCV